MNEDKAKRAWEIICETFTDEQLTSGKCEFVFEVMPFDAIAPDNGDGPFVIGDWNTHVDLGRRLEAEGCEIVFGDDHDKCSDCGGCVETEPSWFGWTPRYVHTSEGPLCDRCARDMWRVVCPESGKIYITPWDTEVNGVNKDGSVFLADLPEDFDYDAVDEYLESARDLIVKASHNDSEAIEVLRKGINEAADPLPPRPAEVDDAEAWQTDYLDVIIADEGNGWRAFVVSIDFDPDGSWEVEGDELSERERTREAREYPWHACMSMPGCLDTSCHVRGKTSKEALHALAQAITDGGPRECSEDAYKAALDD